jgi:hypothetical protein
MKRIMSWMAAWVLAWLVGCAGLRAADVPDASAAERQKLIGAIPLTGSGAFTATPNPQGDYVYEASVAKVLLTGGSFTIRENQFVPGLTVAAIDQRGVPLGILANQGLYWKLGAIQPGNYFVGLVYRSDNGTVEGPAPWHALYLNGRIIQCSTLSDPVQIAPGVWFAELQSAGTEPLKPGDEIAVTPPAGGALTVARLVLHAKAPARGAHRVFTNFEGFYGLPYTALRINAQCDFLDTKGNPLPPENPWWGQQQQTRSPEDFLRDPSGKAVAACQIANPLPVPLAIEYRCVIRSHYLKTVGQDSATLTLQPHECVTRKVLFETLPDEPAYFLHTTVKAVNPPELGWPEADTASYFPGLRQSVPWPDAFNNKYHRRVFFNDPVKGARQTCVLNGTWEIAYTTELNPVWPSVQPDLKFQPLNVPFASRNLKIDKMTPRPHGAYVRRTFEVAPEIAAGSCRLVIQEVVSAATVYVNGKKAGGWRGECTPVVVDVSGLLKAGPNDVVVVLQDLLAIMDPAYVNLKNPTLSSLYLDAPGLDGSDSVRIGDVSLETSPAVCAQDVLVMPSFRKQALATRMNVANRTDKPLTVLIKAVVSDGDRDAFELGQKECTLAGGKVEDVSFDKPWRDAHLYAPQDPFLYVLAVSVVDKATGKTLDVARERFGFRECWIDGAHVYYNGHVAKFKGVTGANALGIDADYQINRGAKTPDFMDEIGLLASENVTGVFNTPSKHNVEHEPFWKAAAAGMVVAVGRVQNHPCIVAWDLSNEWYCFLPYCGADMKKGAQRLENLTTELLKQDPTRWTFYDGDGDLGGLHINYCGHYITWAVQPPIAGYDFSGHSVYLPDGGFYRLLDGEFKPAQKIRFSQFYDNDFFVLYGKKVVMNTENLWKVGSLMPPGPCKIVGDEDVLSPAVDQSGPMAWFWKNNLDGHRDMGTTSVSSYMLQGATRRGYMLQQFILPEVVHHGFAGKPLAIKYDVLNDQFVPAELTFKWSLVGTDGKAVAGDQKVFKLAAADLQREAFVFTYPAVDKRTTFVLDARLEAQGKLVYGEQRDIEVWPATAGRGAGKLARNIVLFDPKGQTAAAFKAAGVEFQTASGIAAPAGDAAQFVFVIGEQALDAGNAARVAELDAFAAAGGKVLILAQSVSPNGLPAAVRIDTREWSSQTFVRAGSHPILQGLSSWDLHFWAPDRVVARGAYNKPDNGPALTLVDSGTDIGMEWVQMMELYRGKGVYLLCQLPVAGSFQTEPLAGELLWRMVDYLGNQPSYQSPAGKLQVIAKADGLIHNALRQAGVAFELAKPDAPAVLDAKALVLLDAAAKPNDEQVAAWAKALQSGATFVVCGAGPEDAATLSKLAGAAVRVTVPPYAMWAGRAYRAAFDKLTAGLSHCDLYFKRYDGTEPAGGQAEDPKLIIEPLQDFAVSAEAARELVFPGAMMVMKVGEGRLIIDERRWMTGNERLARYAQRNLTALALGLGVEVAPVAISRQLPKDIAYQPVDLTPFANRALVDDVADDGQGGWSDQGSKADLRTFPTGRQLFESVPFVIDKERSCIVLSSVGRPGANALPREVTIPIGFKAEGFYFLHSAAYSGPGLTGLYQIQYADGSTFDIPLRGGENIRDWAETPGPFLREKGTTSVVAWTGKCEMFPVICVSRMLWVNPKPDVAVKAIRFSNPRMEPVPIMLGLTVAVAKGQKTETGRELAEVQDLLSRAGKAVAAKDDKTAEDLLKKAVAIDPTMTTAQQALADLYERTGNEEAAFHTYQAWVQAGARTPLPYNRIGEMLENRKDFAGALEAYSSSLKVEWNQPPIITAKKRVEDAVKK